MSEPVQVEILEASESSRPLGDLEISALVRVEEIRLERTKIRSGALVIAIALLAWAAVCHATC